MRRRTVSQSNRFLARRTDYTAASRRLRYSLEQTVIYAGPREMVFDAHYVRAVNLSATTRAIRGEMHPSETFRAANAMRFDALAMYLDARRISSLKPRQCCENEARKKRLSRIYLNLRTISSCLLKRSLNLLNFTEGVGGARLALNKF